MIPLARWRLRREQRRLERALDGPWNRAVSLELDRIVAALEVAGVCRDCGPTWRVQTMPAHWICRTCERPVP